MSDDMGLGLEDDYGGFFTPLENTKPFFKASFEGFPGSGKTYTMACLAIWLHRFIGSKTPITILDSEKAFKFLKHLFDEAKIKVLHKETRSMADMRVTMRLMRDERISDVLLVDSITHFWEDFLESYKAKKKKNQGRLDFGDWGIIKPTWRREFSEPLVQDPYHIMFTGRAGFEYQDVINEETGKHESFKSGIKMRAEGETAYEPDLLVLMERQEDVLESVKTVYRTATIIKDRSTLIDGKTFRNPTPEMFAPCIERCLAAGVVRAKAIQGDAGQLFETEEDQREWFRRRDIALEEIENALVERWPTQGGADRAAKITALKTVFRCASWVWLKSQRPEFLEEGKKKLEALIAEDRAGQAAAVAAEGPPANGEGKPADPREAAPGPAPAGKKGRRAAAA